MNNSGFFELLINITSRIRSWLEKKLVILRAESQKIQKFRKTASSPYLDLAGPKRKKPYLLKLFYLLLMTCLILGSLLFYLGWFLLTDDRPEMHQSPKIIIKIPKNASAQDIALLLKEQGMVRNPVLFRMGVKIFRADKNLHAGIFAIKPDLTISELIDVITGKNKESSQVVFTIPEGFSLTDIAGLLEQKQIVSANEFMDYAKYGALGTLADIFPFLTYSPTTSLEGYLYPDTYVVVPGLSAHQIAKLMLDRFNEKIYDYYLKNKKYLPVINDKKLTFHEVLTLAAIVEKEAVLDKERAVIAQVFLSRLKNKISFGSDPTVKYSLHNEHKAIVTFDDIKNSSPYNTYRFRGLPPGPIASPGFKSFYAVLHPAGTKYLYFIAKGDGSHYFSYNQQQHDNLRSKLGYNQ